MNINIITNYYSSTTYILGANTHVKQKTSVYFIKMSLI